MENKRRDSDEEEPEYVQYKIVLLGDGTVGKTSLAMRFADDQFGKAYKQTIGVDFLVKRLVLPGDVHVALQIWDIGGQTIGSKMMKNYLFGAHAVILTYDITNYQSFQDLSDWLAIVRRAYEGQSQLPHIILLGNKTDLSHLRAVKGEKHNMFAEENGMFSFFCSAKTGDQVNASFHRIAADLAGVMLSKPEIEVTQRVVRAELVNHDRNDPELPDVHDSRPKKSQACSIQ
eukprot:GILI01010118.1.p1 GENE.GILI01010118.1~~GILI01010118.1.p1  ORF type:complete len:231 (+),score=49.80 GILI01010118.1:83-775(+)